jgi:RES domain-containing protein
VNLWRICKQARATSAFDGEGARRYPGRWNHRGTPMVYCTTALSLGVLEVFVHLDPDELPDDLVAIRDELPDDLVPEEVELRALPAGWSQTPGPAALQDLGSAWVAASRGVALSVPSAIIPAERNILLNPGHPAIARLVRKTEEPFVFDPRMRKDAGRAR